MHSRKRRFQGTTIVLALTIILYGGVAFALDPSVNILGDVAGTGSAEIKVFDRWIPVAGKAYPVADGANLRSGNGRMSITLREGVRIEMGKNSECVIFSASNSGYVVHVAKGSVDYRAPQGVSFAVTTNTSNIQGQVGHEPQRNVNGAVTYDDKGTKVMMLSGSLVVKDAGASGAQSVVTDKALYAVKAESGQLSTPAYLSSEAATGAARPAQTTDMVPGGARTLEGRTLRVAEARDNKDNDKDKDNDDCKGWDKDKCKKHKPPVSPCRP
ncbi:MAG: hypothetical protein ABSA46_14150 [Thermodesulfovibrionales bacterium]